MSFREGSAEALPFDDNSMDVVFSSTVIQRVNADLMLPEMVRVTKPGGRVGVLGHAHDMNRWVNLPLNPDLKTRIESPPWVEDRGHPMGCDDASLLPAFLAAGTDEHENVPLHQHLSRQGKAPVPPGRHPAQPDRRGGRGMASGSGPSGGRRHLLHIHALPLCGWHEAVKGTPPP